MKKEIIETIIKSIQNVASMSLERVELQTKAHNAIEFSVYELNDTTAKEIEQINFYFRDYANARNKRIHFTAKTCCFNAVYADAVKFDVCLTAERKSNYFKLDYSIENIDSIVYALTYAHLTYLDSKKLVNRCSDDATAIKEELEQKRA